MRNTVLLLCTVLLVASACTDRDDNLTGVQIRIENSTNKNFSLIELEEIRYEDVASGTSTFYQEYMGGIQPDFIQITTDSITHSTTISGTSETDSILPGLYTYKLNSFSESDGMQFEIIED